MPRTKRPNKHREASSGGEDAMKKFNKLVLDQQRAIDRCVEMEIRDIDLAYMIMLSTIKNTYLDKTIGQLKAELYIKEDSHFKHSTTTQSSIRPASHDDGYLTENSSQGSGGHGVKKTFGVPRTVSRSTRRSRSADPDHAPSTMSTIRPHRRRSRSVYRTPAYNKLANCNYPTITPKVAPHTPLTVLRKPRQGEMVISLDGSPVMASNCYTMQADEKATCNILLQDGTMLSLQPKHMRQSQVFVPFSLMDSDVLQQMHTLKENIDKVLKLGQKANIH